MMRIEKIALVKRDRRGRMRKQKNESRAGYGLGKSVRSSDHRWAVESRQTPRETSLMQRL